jgi:hypothetical protein
LRGLAPAYQPKYTTQAPPGGFARLHQIAEHGFAFVTRQQPGCNLNE